MVDLTLSPVTICPMPHAKLTMPHASSPDPSSGAGADLEALEAKQQCLLHSAGWDIHSGEVRILQGGVRATLRAGSV